MKGKLRLSKALDLNETGEDRKSTRLNSSHMSISYAVFCVKKKDSSPTSSSSICSSCHSYGHPQNLHSFPTRRSSDLLPQQQVSIRKLFVLDEEKRPNSRETSNNIRRSK